MITNDLHIKLDELFNTLREDGMTAIALSEKEEVRIKLLGMLQYLTRKEIELKQTISNLEGTIIISDGEGIDEGQLANIEGTINIITITKNDEFDKNMDSK